MAEPLRHSIVNASSQRMLFTVVLCLGICATFVALIGIQTAGFNVWTFEGKRAVNAELRKIRAEDAYLLDANGRRVQLFSKVERKSHVYIIDFIYTRCPTICRTLGSEFQQMQDLLRNARGRTPEVRLLSISIDPEFDTPEKLREQERLLKVDSRYWQFLTPENKSERDRLLTSLGILVIQDGMGGFQHNGSIHVVDDDGILQGIYNFDEWSNALSASGARNDVD